MEHLRGRLLTELLPLLPEKAQRQPGRDDLGSRSFFLPGLDGTWEGATDEGQVAGWALGGGQVGQMMLSCRNILVVTWSASR